LDLKIEGGNFVLGPTGLPQRAEGLEELLQCAKLRIALRRGEFPYDREAGSTFWLWDPGEEHAWERAVALANEALAGLAGVRAVSAKMTEDSKLGFVIQTPLGEEEITLGELGWDL